MQNTSIFVYGSLLFDEVIQAVTGKIFRSQKALLDGYRRYMVMDGSLPRGYPGIVKQPGYTVLGKLLLQVDDQSQALLDIFEGKEYTRAIVDVLIDGKTIPAQSYIYNFPENLDRYWTPQKFQEKHLSDFISRISDRMR